MQQEVAAAHAGIAFGSCHWQEHTPGVTCPHHPTRGKLRHRIDYAPKWHLPIQYFDEDEYTPYDDTKNEIVQVFTAVRNPYSRMVSEYGWLNRYTPKNQLSAEDMNDVLSSFISIAFDAEPGSPAYFVQDGHFIAQYDYVFGVSENKNSHHYDQNREIIAVHTENLTQEVNCLARRYGLNLTLTASKSKKSSLDLTVADLTPSTK